MNRYTSLIRRIKAGECILIDGATGTEVERRGVAQLENAWNGGAALSDPEILRQVHQDYIRNGAEIVISNTFATHWHALADAGVEADFEAYNRLGVEIAIEARELEHKPDVLVAGGISYWSWSRNPPSLKALKDETARQAAIMAAAGADLLMLEMMVDIDRMLVTLNSAQSSGLPVWVGLTCKPGIDGSMVLRNGEPLVDALAAIDGRDVDLVNIMHTEVSDIDACLDVLQAHWLKPVGVYAHTGNYIEAESRWVYDGISPVDYAAAAQRWVRRGVRVIGGCCGIEPRHIQELRNMV